MIRYSSAAESAARFRAHYESRRRLGRRGEIITRNERADQRAALRDLVLSKIGRLIPTRITHLRRAIGDEWGNVDIRRIARVLDELVADGSVTWTGEGYRLVSARRAA